MSDMTFEKPLFEFFLMQIERKENIPKTKAIFEMDSFGYEINESNDTDAIDLGFVNRSDFSSSDVERVLLESHDGLLNTIVPINGCQDTSLFLNPINDVCDVGEFGIANSAVTREQNTPNSIWSVQERIFDLAGSTNDLSTVMGMENFEANSLQQPQVLASDGDSRNKFTDHSIHLTDYRKLDLTSTMENEYTSTFNQLFFNNEQHQIAYIATPPSHGEERFNQKFSENMFKSVVSLPSSTAVTTFAMNDDYSSDGPLNLANNQVKLDYTAPLLVENKINTTTFMHPISMKNSQPQHQDIYSQKIPSGIVSQQLFQKDINQSLDCKHNILEATNTLPLTNIRSDSNTNYLKNDDYTNSESIYERKSVINNKQLTCDGSHLTLMGLTAKNVANWTAVFPRQNFIQPPEMIILQPLCTRKLIASSNTTSNIGVITSEVSNKPISTTSAPSTVVSADTTPSVDQLRNNSNNLQHTNMEHTADHAHKEDVNPLETFDKTSINIPMIKERSRPECKNENRRKQKLHIIPGAENLVFEVQSNDNPNNNGVIEIQRAIGELNKNENNDVREPYPGTEDLFRPKKNTNTAAAGSKRRFHTSQSISVGNKCDAIHSIVQQQKPSVVPKETSNTLEEKMSVSIIHRKEKSDLSADKNSLTLSSESDSTESIDDNCGQLRIGTSLKCINCMKLFKTTRSLTIHSKRCENLYKKKSGAFEDGNNKFNTKNNYAGRESGNKINPTEKVNQSTKLSLKFNDIADVNEGCYMRTETTIAGITEENSKIPSQNNKINPRPLTRSQTRRSTGRSIPYSAFAKYSK